MHNRHEQIQLSDVEQQQRVDMARRLVEEAHRNIQRPEISVELARNVPGALGDEHAIRWLAHESGELEPRASHPHGDQH